jgi:hypothetical protein
MVNSDKNHYSCPQINGGTQPGGAYLVYLGLTCIPSHFKVIKYDNCDNKVASMEQVKNHIYGIEVMLKVEIYKIIFSDGRKQDGNFKRMR